MSNDWKADVAKNGVRFSDVKQARWDSITNSGCREAVKSAYANRTTKRHSNCLRIDRSSCIQGSGRLHPNLL
jgi:hypothetical protein